MQRVYRAKVEGRGAGGGEGGGDLFPDGAGLADAGEGDTALEFQELSDKLAEALVKLGGLLEYGLAFLLENSPSFFDNIVRIGAHGTEG